MFSRVAALAVVLTVALALTSCQSVPLTGRSQLNLVPASTMLSMSQEQYGQFLKENKVSGDARQTQRVRDVGQRIARAVEDYLTATNLGAEVKEYKWEFNLIEDKAVNAWAMPGGKVVVYTGILPVTRSEAGLATVLGHEIGHVVAKHGNERMSQGLLAQFGGVALSVALNKYPAQTQQLWMGVYGAGAQYGILLPYSRLQEYEADKLGLVFMAMAGYDPEEAVSFWQRMAAEKKGEQTPEFLSTHPTDANRIARLRELVPMAKAHYRGK